MGWGIEFSKTLYLSKQEYNSQHEVEEAIKDCENHIKGCQEKILMYASATPKDVVQGDFEEEPITKIHIELNEELQFMEETYNKLFLLREYLEYLTKKQDI